MECFSSKFDYRVDMDWEAKLLRLFYFRFEHFDCITGAEYLDQVRSKDITLQKTVHRHMNHRNKISTTTTLHPN